MSDRTCQACGTKVIGRMDKKFCSDQCRTDYYNKAASEEHHVIRKINSILRKNRRILVGLNQRGKTKVEHKKLVENGFNFDYSTSFYVTKKGTQYFYCYDQGYLKIDDDRYLLVVNKNFK